MACHGPLLVVGGLRDKNAKLRVIDNMKTPMLTALSPLERAARSFAALPCNEQSAIRRSMVKEGEWQLQQELHEEAPTLVQRNWISEWQKKEEFYRRQMKAGEVPSFQHQSIFKFMAGKQKEYKEREMAFQHKGVTDKRHRAEMDETLQMCEGTVEEPHDVSAKRWRSSAEEIAQTWSAWTPYYDHHEWQENWTIPLQSDQCSPPAVMAVSRCKELQSSSSSSTCSAWNGRLASIGATPKATTPKPPWRQSENDKKKHAD
jgi:hypothetical protein